ncbi:variable surface protein [Plasmodium gonderi]|uniref:Variable surface protein n=1 Tax=Plasmodium gonderi TaxID=77519 RepID=A0A1Y1JT62_PLAGO|nr:variable surface protein [Plasmodium gonderi]GAW84628.1 variable surface protein [Plasmodium gonderi]
MKSLIEDENLKKLPSKVKYAIFNNASDNYSSCTIEKNVIKLKETNPGIENVYDKIVKVLCHVYNNDSAGSFDTADCDYLYFWLCDLLYRNLTYTNSLYTVMYAINHILQKSNGVSICNFDKYYYYNINKEIFMDFKVLFDYSKDYDKLVQDTTASNGPCSRDYTKLLNQYVIEYNKYKFFCNKEPKHNINCKLFEEFFKNKDPQKLCKLSCNSRNNYYKYAKQKEHHSGVAESGVKTVEQRTSERQQELLISGLHTSPYVDVLLGNTNKEVNVQDLIYDKQELYPLDIEGPQQSAFIDFSASSSSKNMVIPTLLIGITVLSVILGKFTPVGYWLKKALVGKSKGKCNIIMDSNITEDYTIPENLDSSRRFHVRYSNIY